MLKKAGIIAAVATAGVLALTPFAFADNDRHDDEITNVWVEEGDVERDQINECSFDQDVAATAELIPQELLVTQSQNGNCVNAGDDSEVGAAEEAEVLPILP